MSNINEIQLIIWEAFKNSNITCNVEELQQLIVSDACKEKVLAIRAMDKLSANKLKKTLPAITFSGLFDKQRTKKDVIKYTQLLVLDIDNLSQEELIRVKELAIKVSYSILVFISPSGNGLKIVVSVDSELDFHEEAYKQVCFIYETELSVKFDEKTHDITRLCFLSWDEDCYYNSDADIISIDPRGMISYDDENEDVQNNSDISEDLILKIEETIKFTENKSKFTDNNRNNFIFLLSINCNNKGYPKEMVINYLIKKYTRNGFPEEEIKTVIEGVYKSKKSEFGRLINKVNNKQIEHPQSIKNNVSDINFMDFQKKLISFKKQLKLINDDELKDEYITIYLTEMFFSK